MKLYKLTDSNDCTMNDTQWGEGIEHTASGKGELCSSGFLHAYEHPLVAVFINPVHGDFRSPHLWLAEGDIAKRDGQLKCGCTRLKTIKRMDLPVITTEQRVEVAIRCAKLVCDDEAWNTWADKWLSGEDRTAEAAAEARAAEARAEARAAAAAARAEAAAAAAAAWTAAAWTAAAWATEWAEEAAARTVALADSQLDLISILEEVCGGGS